MEKESRMYSRPLSTEELEGVETVLKRTNLGLVGMRAHFSQVGAVF
jgi:hypothetical protein